MEDFDTICRRNADRGQYQNKVEELFVTSQNGQIGLRLKMGHDATTSLRLQRLKQSNEIQQSLEGGLVGLRFEVYLKNDDNDEKDKQLTMQNGLCLIDTFKRLVEFHTLGTTSECTVVEELNHNFLIFLESIIEISTNNNSDKDILERMLEFAKDAVDTQGNERMFTPFPNDDLIRMLLPQIHRILLQEPTGLTTNGKFDQLVSISNVSATGSFSYDQLNSLLEIEKLLVFKLGNLHFWPSLDEKEWEKRPQEDFSETIILLSKELEALNQEYARTTNITLSDAIDKKTMVLTANGENHYMIRQLLIPHELVGKNRVDSIGKKVSKHDVDEYLCGEDSALEIVAVEYNNKDQGSKKYSNFEPSTLCGALQNEVRECVEKAFNVITDMIDKKLSPEKLEERLSKEFASVEDPNDKDYEADIECSDGEEDKDDDDDDDDYDNEDEKDDDSNDADDSDRDDNASGEADEVVSSGKLAKKAFYLYLYFCSENTIKVFNMQTNIICKQIYIICEHKQSINFYFFIFMLVIPGLFIIQLYTIHTNRLGVQKAVRRKP